MAIMQNIPCPSCQETGHDKSGNHLIVFEDGARLCTKSHFHKTGNKLYIPSDGEDPLTGMEVNGTIKYSPDQFNTLLDEGKLDNPRIRSIALSGMRMKDAYGVMTNREQANVELDWSNDMLHFKTLGFKNLASRAIKGAIAKLYNVRVGLGATGAVERHYYPRYGEDGNLIGAKCRTLPKDFSQGTLGKVWGDSQLFGESTMKAVSDSGRRMDTLILTGGELDALAAQQMLTESQVGTRYEGQLYHIWSVNKGEACIKEIINRKDKLNRFKRILLAFDDDETGQRLARDVARLFRDKAMIMKLPCKDPNACLIEGRSKEFVDSFFKPIDPFQGGVLKRVSSLIKGALVMPEMGKSWPWPSMDPLTFGIRYHALYVLGAGTGVGKTKTTKEIVHHLMDVHNETVGVIYLEEQPTTTVRSFAGQLINKAIENPPMNDPSVDGYSADLDYSEHDASEALYELERRDRLIVADTGGDKSIDTVMDLINELLAMGVKRIVVDNLTAIELPKGGSKVEAIDEAMKRIGKFKDEKEVTIFLLAHLKRPQEPRVGHENGGEVLIGDFRGAGSITFWANVAIGIERNTNGMTDEEKRLTTFRIVKCRDRGISVGRTVLASMSAKTGRLLQVGKSPVTTDFVKDVIEDNSGSTEEF